MCRLVYYVSKANNGLCSRSAEHLAGLQECEEVTFQQLDGWEDLAGQVGQDFSEKNVFFSLQMITSELTMPMQMSIRYLGSRRSKDQQEQYMQMLEDFIRISDKQGRFLKLGKIVGNIDRDICEKVSMLEEIFEEYYRCEVPQTSTGQMEIAIWEMEKRWNSNIQAVRRKDSCMGVQHFYQVIGFGKESISWGKTDEQSLMSFDGNLIMYRFMKAGDCIVKYDIREFYATRSEELDVLVKAYKSGQISDKGLILHVTEEALEDCLSAKLEVDDELPLAQGHCVGRGAAFGKVIFGNESLEELHRKKGHYILVKNDLTPMDVEYIYIADGIITGKCSSTSHQTVIAKQLGKVFVFACNDLRQIGNRIYLKEHLLHHDSELSIDGKRGYIFRGRKKLCRADSTQENCRFIMDLCGRNKNMGILANTESTEKVNDVKAICWEGVGLYRTEYMPPQNRLKRLLQKAVLAVNYKARMKILTELQSVWESELSKILKTVGKSEITIRTLDYPSQELFFGIENELLQIAADTQMTAEDIENSLSEKREENGMLGNRGSRFSICYPEIFETQIHAIFRAYCAISDEEKPVLKLLFPMISDLSELEWMKSRVERIVAHNTAYQNLDYKLGIMIETPRAIFVINQLVKMVDFISFGTNDLTQLVWGISREDHFKIVNRYKWNGLLENNPYEVLDDQGIMPLIVYAVEKARRINPKIEVGICGTQAFSSQTALWNIGVDYISINPNDIPYAVLQAAKLFMERVTDSEKSI